MFEHAALFLILYDLIAVQFPRCSTMLLSFLLSTANVEAIWSNIKSLLDALSKLLWQYVL